jgi:hypothetical protein
MRAHRYVRAVALLCIVVATLAGSGCGSRTPSSEAMKQQLGELKGNIIDVAKFSGKVTIDGQPPFLPPKSALVLILYDAKDAQPGHETMMETVCDKEGHFEFTRYSKGDGVPPGSYTVLFAEFFPRRGGHYIGPDKLGNLYNDPDKSPFHVDIKPSGKTDWEFNLEVAGKDPVPAGPHAVTRILNH